MAGNKKISQLTDGGAVQSADAYVIERGGVNFQISQGNASGNPGGLLLDGIVNDFIVKDEKEVIALEQRLTLPPALSFVDNTAVPPTEVDEDIYLLDDTGATNVAWDGAAVNSWVRFDGLAGLWKEITALDGMFCTLVDTGFVRVFNPTSSVWELFGVATPAGANTEIQFNAAGIFGASSLFTFDTGFGVFSCDAAAVFNDGGTDQDFRIEGLSDANLFFLDASVDGIGIGTTSVNAAYMMTITPSTITEGGIIIQNTSSTNNCIRATNTGSTAIVGITSNSLVADGNGVAGNAVTGKGVQGVATGAGGTGVLGFVNGTNGIGVHGEMGGDTAIGLLVDANGGHDDLIGMVLDMPQPGADNANESIEWSRLGSVTFKYTNDFLKLTEDPDNTGNVVNIIKGSESYKINSEMVVILASFTVATLPGQAAGGQIHVSDETGGAVNAYSDGVNWRRVSDGTIVS